ncbi:M24 family metallopeptidase [Geodermatophilus obscurus]|uniref:Peptidase M24 n=1 Tax=Geodermatophilus obscurus (strain ATCC 25078 / DSM 43160 / JCM 3152 / CCUG 61914 / KCC A-0152 / KCTC 9177 / NBRC 13315 / NRRL B-3577 / G-20) TaxID=526225 RepID=D2S9F5_GEOOG|nr:Xaa-Pro peptidase family protein [Geodermatophilus obscurus]ADB75755.1 peptidase M24 [Geodermatophilus obscurus DSM 43160]
MRYAARRERLRATATERGLDAVLVTDLLNVRYLTGFTGSNGALLLRADGGDVFGTDGRYTTQAGTQVPDLELLVDRGTVSALAREAVLPRSGRPPARTIGYESHHLTVDGLRALESVLADAAGGIVPELTSVRRAVEALRAVKDDDEIDALRRACAVADAALAELAAEGALRPGRTELQVGRELDSRMLTLGAEAPSFETIVATGANSAIPHHRPDSTELRAGDLLKLDFGATVDGYHSDMTRTVVLGGAADWQREVYELVAAAQAAGRAALAVGADVVAVDAAARDVIARAGHAEHFPHGLGHGVGLEIHEAPGIGQLGAGRLAAGMAVTVEPGVYLPGHGGVRIEDTLIVTDDEPELLTLTSKELLVL